MRRRQDGDSCIVDAILQPLGRTCLLVHCGFPRAMFATKPVTIEIVASGMGPAEISLLASGPTTAEYEGDAAFAFKVLQEGDGHDNQDAPAPATTLNNNIISNSNLQEEKLFTHSNGHIPQEAQFTKKASNGSLPNQFTKNLFFSRNNENKVTKETEKSSTTGVSMSFLQSLDAKLQRLHDFAGRHTRPRRSTEAANNNNVANNSNNHIVQHKKPFMTVVRQGTFLKPPPEVAALLGLSTDSSHASSSQGSDSSLNASQQPLLYSFSSRPRVLMQSHRRQCEAVPTEQPQTDADGEQTKSTRRARRDVSEQDHDTDDNQLYSNLMYDRRVVRGNTFAHQPLPSADAQEAAAALRQAEARRRAQARRKAQQTRTARTRTGRSTSGTPPPVSGRQHLDVQTDRYLEEILDKPVECEACCQTDLFVERPPTPQFVPPTAGKDAETQIMPGELFDFDNEVEPILEVLVGRTMQQALAEVLEEEDFAATQVQRARIEEARRAHFAEKARLEEQERRMRLEKERVGAEHRAVNHDSEDRLSAISLPARLLEEHLPAVLHSLQESGVISDKTQQDVDEHFMPWLMSEVQEEYQKLLSNKDVLTDIVRDVIETRVELQRAMGKQGDATVLSSSSSDTPIHTTLIGESGDGDAGSGSSMTKDQ